MKGRPTRYSAAELRFIESHRTMTRKELHAAFAKKFRRKDVTYDHIRELCSRRRWTTGRQRRWRASDDAILRKLYPDTPTVDVARRIGRTLSSTYGRAQDLGLCKSEAYLASPAACRLRRGDHVGAATRFKKGQVPPNKGLRRPGFAPGRMRETQFKKGERRGVAVKLYKPIGTERLSKDGYLERKIHDGWPPQSRWRAVHLVRWEEINGRLPKGMALKSLDGNKGNTDPSNWTLVSRGVLPRLNGIYGRGYDKAPAELKPTILALAQLEQAASERSGRQARGARG